MKNIHRWSTIDISVPCFCFAISTLCYNNHFIYLVSYDFISLKFKLAFYKNLLPDSFSKSSFLVERYKEMWSLNGVLFMCHSLMVLLTKLKNCRFSSTKWLYKILLYMYFTSLHSLDIYVPLMVHQCTCTYMYTISVH